jgi:site-specific DNA recombinase
VSYLRVSTKRQANDGLSLGDQTARANAYGVAHDVDIVGIEHDALSGKDTHRPGLQRALAMLDDGRADGLLVAKMDRLTRSVRDLDELVFHYFRTGRFVLLSMGDPVDTRSASGRLVLMLLIVVSQWEREVIGERTKSALAHLRAIGGGTPRVEGPAAARIQALRLSGLSFRDIAARLIDEGVASRKGGTWAAATVRRVFLRMLAAQAAE